MRACAGCGMAQQNLGPNRPVAGASKARAAIFSIAIGMARGGDRRRPAWSPPRYFTVMRAFGTSPNTSGAYSASARLGGSAKLPALFSRTVYSIFSEPLGRYS